MMSFTNRMEVSLAPVVTIAAIYDGIAVKFTFVSPNITIRDREVVIN